MFHVEQCLRNTGVEYIHCAGEICCMVCPTKKLLMLSEHTKYCPGCSSGPPNFPYSPAVMPPKLGALQKVMCRSDTLLPTSAQCTQHATQALPCSGTLVFSSFLPSDGTNTTDMHPQGTTSPNAGPRLLCTQLQYHTTADEGKP